MEGPYDGKVSVDAWFPVRLVDATDLVTPETGLAFGDLTVKYGVEAATAESTYTPTADDWKEQGQGNYWLRMGAAEFTVASRWIVNVAAAGSATVTFVAAVKDLTDQELAEKVDAAIDVDGRMNVGAWLDEPVTFGAVNHLPQVDLAAVFDDPTVAEALADLLNGTGAWLYLAGLLISASDVDGAVVVENDAGPGVVFGSSLGDGLVLKSTGGNGNGLSATGNGNGQGIAAAVLEKLADTVLLRSASHVEVAMKTAGAFDCLAYVPLALRRFSTTANPGFLTIYESDGVTELCQVPLNTDASASPITGTV